VSVDSRALLEFFYDEAAEHLADLEAVLRTMDPRTPDPDGLELMFRAARSAKASSITLGLADVAELVHQFERLLDRLRHEQLVVTAEVRDAGLQASVVLRALLAAHRGTGAVETAHAERARRRLQALAGRGGSGAAPPRPRAPTFPEAADTTVLPVGWRGQGRRGPAPPSDPSRRAERAPVTEAIAREPIGRSQERQGRSGAPTRRK
jgi:two-component system, chemotaxis family, sensor kinase CheA